MTACMAISGSVVTALIARGGAAMKGEAVKAIQKIQRPQHGQCAPSSLRYGPRCGLETEIILRFVCETAISNPQRTRIGSTLLMGGRVT
jgi:hypothetical protein